MFQLVEWFQIKFPKMHYSLFQCDHNFDDKYPNPFHLESDCWSHTMMVCKIAELSGYDKVVQVAALLHDIGKPASRRINPRNNHVQFFGHEELSAKMAIEVLDLMIQDKMIDNEDKKEVLLLIKHHAFLYKHPEANAMMQYFDGDQHFCIHLVQLIRCDSLGRFSPDLPNEEKFDSLFAQIKAN